MKMSQVETGLMILQATQCQLLELIAIKLGVATQPLAAVKSESMEMMAKGCPDVLALLRGNPQLKERPAPESHV